MATEGIRSVKHFTPDEELRSQLASSTHGYSESATAAVGRDGCVYLSTCSGEQSCSFINISIDCDVNKSALPTAVVVVKATAMGVVMATAILGNLLVIASVLHDRRLRNRANSFIVSMAFADLLVAILVMPFSAIQEIRGRWVFGSVTCDIFNANDVLFSTASLLHLCCISVDRYVAVTDPFRYGSKMTRRRAAVMLVGIWLASALLSHVPIHMGWYTTVEHRQHMESLPAPTECVFVVNRVYGIVSSIVSFWTPAVVMVFAYRKIFREASRQERSIRLIGSGSPQPSLESQASTKISGGESLTTTAAGGGAVGRGSVLLVGQDPVVNGTCSVSRRLNRHHKKIQRDHKAARTLGIIMGAFLSCWLPFFTWYLTETMCGELRHTPPIVIFLLFWVGYLNSALNPVIYPFFNRDFRDAFRRLFRCLGCGVRGCYSGRTSPVSGRSSSSFHLVAASRGVRSAISIRRKQVVITF